jgi:hypothetical protein
MLENRRLYNDRADIQTSPVIFYRCIVSVLGQSVKRWMVRAQITAAAVGFIPPPLYLETKLVGTALTF